MPTTSTTKKVLLLMTLVLVATIDAITTTADDISAINSADMHAINVSKPAMFRLPPLVPLHLLTAHFEQRRCRYGRYGFF